MTGVLELQVTALLRRVLHVRDERVGELRAAGAAQVEEARVAGRREARRLLHAAMRAKRERVRERCRGALAELDASRRKHGFDADTQLIASALAALPAALEARWRDPAARRSWCERAVGVAAARLVARDWTIALAGEVGADERAALDAAVASAGAHASYAPSTARAGLVVSAGSSRVDATVPGLVGDAEAIAAQLLALAAGGSS